MSETCEHKYVHLRSDGYYKSYRYSNTFHLHDFYFCEKCLTEKQIDKSESVSIYSPEEIPDWARHITKKVNCE